MQSATLLINPRAWLSAKWTFWPQIWAFLMLSSRPFHFHSLPSFVPESCGRITCAKGLWHGVEKGLSQSLGKIFKLVLWPRSPNTYDLALSSSLVPPETPLEAELHVGKDLISVVHFHTFSIWNTLWPLVSARNRCEWINLIPSIPLLTMFQPQLSFLLFFRLRSSFPPRGSLHELPCLKCLPSDLGMGGTSSSLCDQLQYHFLREVFLVTCFKVSPSVTS